MAVNRAVSSHGDRMGLTQAGVPDSAIMRLGRMTLRAKVDEADHSTRMSEPPFLSCGCNIREMPGLWMVALAAMTRRGSNRDI